MNPAFPANRFVESEQDERRGRSAWLLVHPFVRAVVAAVLLLLACSEISAQEYLTATGKPNSATTEPFEMGFMDLSSGGLHLEFPVGSFPQRGHSEPLSLRLTYENHVWTTQSDGTTLVWAPPSNDTFPWAYPLNWNVSAGLWKPGNISSGARLCNQDYSIVDAAGTQHAFHIVVGDGNASCSKAPGDFYATDSSGFRVHVVDFPNYDMIFYAPDGTIIPYNDTTYQINNSYANDGSEINSLDSNGNYLSAQAGSWAIPFVWDTAGRIFGTNLGGIPNPCPNPTVATYDWNCYGVPNSQMVGSPFTGQLPSWYYMTWVKIPVKTAFGQQHVTECTTNCFMSVIQKLTLPDNSVYTFTYDCDSSSGISACDSPAGQSGYYGTMSTMTLPTGGKVSYGYSTFFDVYTNATRYLTSRTVGAGTWYYNPWVGTTCNYTQVGCQQGVTVQPPDGSLKEITFTVDNGSWPTLSQTWDANFNLLRSESNTWDFTNSCPLYFCTSTYYSSHAYIRKLSSMVTDLGAGGSSVTKKTAYTYDGIQTGNVTAVKEWKYQPGTSPQFAATPDRATNMTYLTAGYNIINKPTKITVCSNSGTDSDCPGGGSKVSQTKFTYDSYGTGGLTNVAGIVNHDDTHFSSSNTVRGNPTQVSRWVSGTSYLVTQFSYDSTGQVVKMTDPKGNVTTYGYSDNFYSDNGANPPAKFQLVDPATNRYVNTNSLRTSVTDAIGTTTTGYYWGGGKLGVATDYNGVASYSHHLDPLDRTNEADLPATWKKVVYTSPAQTDAYTPEYDTTPSAGCSSCIHAQMAMDGLGHPLATTLVNNPAGAVTVSSTYDLLGRLASMSHSYFSPSDPNHVFENYSYDTANRPLSFVHPDGQSLRSAYGNEVVVHGGLAAQQGSTSIYGVGTPVLGISESGAQSQKWIDGFGNVIEVDEPASGAMSLTAQVMISGYDWAGDPVGHVTITVNNYSRTVNYDSSSTQDSIATALASAFNSDPASPVTASTGTGPDCDTSIGPNCVVVLKTKTAVSGPYSLSASALGAAGDSSGYTPDAGSFSMLVTNPAATFYSYDVLGHLVSVVQGAQTRTYQYDGLGRPIKSITPEKGTETLSYLTSTGTLCSGVPENVCVATDARGYTKTYSYDSANRLIQVVHNPSTTGTVTYNYGTSASQYNIGRIVTMADPSGSETYTYDSMGRMTSLSKVIGGVTYKTSLQYNAAGDLTQLTYPSGRVVQYSYDKAGHLCAVAISTGSCTSYANPYLTIASSALDAAGHPLQVTYGNGVVASSSFTPARGQFNTLYYTKGSTTYLGLTYRYQNDSSYCPQGSAGNDGQIQCIVDAEPGRSVRYTYDTVGRLTTANTTGDSAYPAWGLSETYDQYGNRTAQSVTAGIGPSSSVGINTSNNQIVGFGYDASGHVTSEPPSTSSTYSYDVEDCLTNYTGSWIGASAVYTCDGNHMRVKKVVTGTGAVTRVYIYLGSRVIAEYDNGVAVNAPSREYIYGKALLAVVAGGTTNYFLHDHQSVRMITDSNGNAVLARGHYPYGELWYRSNTTTSNEWTFTTYQRDDESLLDYAQARYYASGSGRFMSADPVHGNPNNPLSWNRYVYASNDPINNSDASGMDDSTDWGMNPDDGCPDCVVYDDGSSINVAIDAVFLGVSTAPNSGSCAPYCGYDAAVLATNSSGQATAVYIFTSLALPAPPSPLPPPAESDGSILSMMADPRQCADCGAIFNGTSQFTNIVTAGTAIAVALVVAAPAIGAGGAAIYQGGIKTIGVGLGWYYAAENLMDGKSGYVLGRDPGYLEAAKDMGAGALKAGDGVYKFFTEAGAWDTLNRAYINAQIFANQQVYLSTAPIGQEGNTFGMEIQHLVSKGIGPDQWKFVPNRFLY